MTQGLLRAYALSWGGARDLGLFDSLKYSSLGVVYESKDNTFARIYQRHSLEVFIATHSMDVTDVEEMIPRPHNLIETVEPFVKDRQIRVVDRTGFPDYNDRKELRKRDDLPNRWALAVLRPKYGIFELYVTRDSGLETIFSNEQIQLRLPLR
ncbi:hypothetical protein HYV86_01410 [Candidatus Woesearchaeota archaeon]|nr:hypothetical protein [Candidatus Woesearchaeota archaeon]